MEMLLFLEHGWKGLLVAFITCLIYALCEKLGVRDAVKKLFTLIFSRFRQDKDEDRPERADNPDEPKDKD